MQLTRIAEVQAFSAYALLRVAACSLQASSFATPFLRRTPTFQAYFICAVTLGA